MPETSTKLDGLSPVKQALLQLRAMQARIDELEQGRCAPVAVIGMGLRFPGGARDPESFWRLLTAGTDAITEVPPERWDAEAYFDPDPLAPGKMVTRWGGFLEGIDQFDPDFFGIAEKEAVSMDPQQRLLLEVAWEALEHAGRAPDRLFGTPGGVFIGISSFDYLPVELKRLQAADIDAYFSSGVAHSVAAGRLSYTLGLQGPCLAVDTACSSSLVALHLACQSLRLGECHLAIAGGVNLILAPEFSINFSKARMMAADGRCKTFDAAADGYVRGEGCGLVVLRRLTDALADGDRILAVIRGSAVNQDGRSSGLTAPNGPAQQAVIRRALAEARLTPSQVGYVEAHGTGTSLGDPIEVQALAEVFGDGRSPADPLLIGSVKTNIGHLEAAAGIAGFIKLVLALRHGVIPPHLHLRRPNPHVAWEAIPVAVAREGTPWPAAGAAPMGGVSSFGFSGTNAHVLVGPPPAAPPPSPPRKGLQLFPVSARSEAALQELLQRQADALACLEEAALEDACHTAGAGRTHFEHRAAFIAGGVADLVAQLRAAARAGGEGRRPPPADPEVVFMFTGQGANVDGMGRDLWDREPVFREAFAACARLLDPYLPAPLTETLYPAQGPPGSLEASAAGQAALFALQTALAALWRAWGIRPAAVIGHSFGEYAAACAAGVLSLADAARLVGERARLLQSLPATGAMAAVLAGEAQVRRLLEPWAGRLAIAGLNGPRNTVVSGEAQALQDLLERLAREGVRAIPLAVSQAFHSPLVAPVLERFEDLVRGLASQPPRLPMISSLTGRLLPAERAPAPEYWRRQLGETVRFADGLQALHARGHRTFIELGPQPVLCGMGREILEEEGCLWLPSLRQGSGDGRAILESLAQLYGGGLAVDWAGLQRGRRPARVSLATYPFQRHRCWPPAGPARPAAAGAPDRVERVLAAGRRQSRQVPMDLDLGTYASKWACLEDLTRAYIVQALRGLGVFGGAGEAHRVADLAAAQGVSATYGLLLERWLDGLVRRGLLAREGDRYRALQALPEEDLPAQRERAARVLADLPPLLTYLERCGAMLVAVLTGRESPLETLFPGGDAATAEWIYRDWALSRYFNAVVGAVAAAALETLPAGPEGEPLRIVEIGAGTGSTTHSVLPVLPPRPLQYVFTDVSEVFFHRARERFRDQPGLVCAPLDIEKDPAAQGFGRGQFQVAIAANVLHATGDLRRTLQHVRSLLAPGGLLVLYEVTAPHAWFDISVALIEGWQRFDDDLRRDGPLLTADGWRSLLEEQGFQAVAAFPEPGSAAEILCAHVIVAHAPAEGPGGGPGTARWAPEAWAGAGPPGAPAEGPAVESAPAAALREQLAQLTAAARREALEEFVQDHVRAVLHRDPAQPIGRRRRLMDLGLDSLMAVDLRNRLSQALGLERKLPASLIFDYPTIEAIADHLAREVLDAVPPEPPEDREAAGRAAPGAAALQNLADEEVEQMILRKLAAMDKET